MFSGRSKGNIEKKKVKEHSKVFILEKLANGITRTVREITEEEFLQNYFIKIVSTFQENFDKGVQDLVQNFAKIVNGKKFVGFLSFER